MIASRPASPDVCDVCGGRLVARDDDTPEALAVRIRAYREDTAPVLRIFERKEYVATIDATESIDTVQAAIRTRFGLPPMPT